MLDKEELKNNIVFHGEPLIPDLSYFNNEVPKIKKYLIGMAPSHAYRARKRGTTVEKARDDDECGKISEIFVDRFLNETYGFPGGGVDYTIKDYRNKNWDLSYTFCMLACKLNYPDHCILFVDKHRFLKLSNKIYM
jgi:hypothetical protein